MAGRVRPFFCGHRIDLDEVERLSNHWLAYDAIAGIFLSINYVMIPLEELLLQFSQDGCNSMSITNVIMTCYATPNQLLYLQYREAVFIGFW